MSAAGALTEGTRSPDLARFFSPRSVAFIGATEDLGKFGGRCVRQLLDFGYEGAIYPINPRRQEVFGLRCYSSVSELPERPDHVGIVLPATAVPEALAECGRAGAAFATVFSSGFGEMGTEGGRALQDRLVRIGREAGLRLMGPNCNGLINFVDRFALTSTATIRGPRRPAGDVAIASQSGGAGQVNVMWRAQEAGLGISYQVSCGNDADLDLLDYMHFMVRDQRTRVILAIAERLSDGDKLRSLAREAAEREKPIVMIKLGRTDAGSRAAASHTGAVTGADDVCDAALRQLGIIRVSDCNELYETAMLLRRGRLPRGRRAAAISISGGNLVLTADLGGTFGLEWPAYSETTQAKIGDLLPGFGKAGNPTDLTAAAIGREGAFAAAARAIVDDPAVETLVPVLTFAGGQEIRSVAAISAESEKPVAILWTGQATDEPALTPAVLVAGGHAVYRDVLPCLRSVAAAAAFREFLDRRSRPAPDRPAGIDPRRARALLKGATGPLSESASKAVLACYGLPMAQTFLAPSAEEAVARAAEIGRPVALKVQSPDIPHKTEAGGVRLGLLGDQAVREAFGEICRNASAYRTSARIDGVLIQEMVTEGHEVLIGLSRDATFGPTLTVGLGGIYVEVFKDVAFRLPPVSTEEARELVGELRSVALLEGARGRAPADLDALADAIARVSWLAVDLGDLVSELDINPIRVLPAGRGVRVIDALIVAGAAKDAR